MLTPSDSANLDKLEMTLLKVNRFRNKIVELYILPKNERTNLFFYPDTDLTTVQDSKTNSFPCFLGDSEAQQFCFKIF